MFFVRSKYGPYRVRDRKSPELPMYEIGGDWVGFAELPASISEHADPYFEVKKADKIDGAKMAEPLKKKTVEAMKGSDEAKKEEPKKVKKGGLAGMMEG